MIQIKSWLKKNDEISYFDFFLGIFWGKIGQKLKTDFFFPQAILLVIVEMIR